MTRGLPKLELSKHQKRTVETARKGHVYAEADVESVLASPPASIVEPETDRTRTWGLVNDKPARAIASATVSGHLPIARIVTAHRDWLPKRR